MRIQNPDHDPFAYLPRGRTIPFWWLTHNSIQSTEQVDWTMFCWICMMIWSSCQIQVWYQGHMVQLKCTMCHAFTWWLAQGHISVCTLTTITIWHDILLWPQLDLDFPESFNSSLSSCRCLTRIWKAIKSPISISYHGQRFRQLLTVDNMVVRGEYVCWVL
jgi:hypothetical protein